MIKKNFPMLIITSIIILIPMFTGLLLWNILPDQIAIHWNAEGNADNFSSKEFAVFAIPIFMLVIHWVCMILSFVDPKNNNIKGKPLILVFWICPIISLLVGTIMYVTALGYNISVEVIIPLILGAVFVAIGNYLPKCKQNYTIGIKVPWTLNDQENWNKTHRFAGIIWVIGGIVIMATSFFGSVFIMLSIVAVMAFVPMVYSYFLYQKNNQIK